MKIVYIFSTLSTKGGTEKILIEKINFFAEHFGYDVTIINSVQQEEDKNSFTISNKVRQINLGIPYFTQYKYKYPKRLWLKWRLNLQLRKAIYGYVKQIDPDILICISRYMADFTCTLKCRAKKIVECHVVKYNKLSIFGEERSLPSRIFRNLYEFLYFRTIEKNADVIVTLTTKDNLLWKKAKRVETIPNFSTIQINQYSNCTAKRVIAVGRLEPIKGFERLIDIWGKVSSIYPDWHLDIYGEGSLHETLNKQIERNSINGITIHKYTSNISQEYATSSICAVTSYYEGFSLVLLEALKHGVPCIAFNCPFGPETIIENGKCGFLIEDGNNNAYVEKLCYLINNGQLRQEFSKSALERVRIFEAEQVMKEWKLLLENLLSN